MEKSIIPSSRIMMMMMIRGCLLPWCLLCSPHRFISDLCVVVLSVLTQCLWFVVNLFSLLFFFMVLVLLVLQSQFLFVFPVSLVESLCLLRPSCLYVSALVFVFGSLVFPVLL